MVICICSVFFVFLCKAKLILKSIKNLVGLCLNTWISCLPLDASDQRQAGQSSQTDISGERNTITTVSSVCVCVRWCVCVTRIYYIYTYLYFHTYIYVLKCSAYFLCLLSISYLFLRTFRNICQRIFLRFMIRALCSLLPAGNCNGYKHFWTHFNFIYELYLRLAIC